MGLRGRSAGAGWRVACAAGASAIAGAFAAPAVAQDVAAPIAIAAEPAPVAPPAVEARWSATALRQLAAAIEGARGEGLDPRAYNLAAIHDAAAGTPDARSDLLADAAALSLAHDFYFGRVSDRAAMGWLIARSPYEQAQIATGLAQAVATGTVDRFFAALLPGDARYASLRTALAGTTDPAARDQLRANMERWRWMPRTLDASYLYVNVPSYRLRVIDEGAEVASYTVVVGAKDTPTPALLSPASSLVVNPWWNVPQSIVRKSNLRPGAAGYQFKRVGTDWQVRQPPGPRNALGRIKFNLVNDQAIYLHDTPAKRGFARDERALSHGCIRVKNIDRLASELVEEGGDAGALDAALAGEATQTVALGRTWQVVIVYFTAEPGADGALVRYGDPYGYDAQVVAALDGKRVEIASRD